MKQFDLVAFNAWAENTWLTEARKLLDGGTKLTTTVFVAELAYRCDISVLTSQRYLQKHSAPSAEFVCSAGSVFMKASATF